MIQPQDIALLELEASSRESSTIALMTPAARDQLRDAARAYRDALKCGYPGCRRRPARAPGEGHPPRYCDLPEHNPQTAYAARAGRPDPITDLRGERDRAIREVYVQEQERYALERAAWEQRVDQWQARPAEQRDAPPPTPPTPAATYREIAAIRGLDLSFQRVAQIVAQVCPECGETLTCAHRPDTGLPRWACRNGHDATPVTAGPRPVAAPQ